MWSERRQPEVNKTDPSARPEVPPFRPEVSPVAANRVGANAANVAVIGKGMVIKGQVRSAEHMHIDGEIDGSLYLAGFDLAVTAQARVRGNVTAREVDVAGVIEGNVEAAKRIMVRRGGRLIGDLRTAGITIEDGAYFKGKIEIVNAELPEPVDTPQVSAVGVAG